MEDREDSLTIQWSGGMVELFEAGGRLVHAEEVASPERIKMLRVYRPHGVEGYEVVVPVAREDWATFRELDGKPVGPTWTAPMVKRIAADEDSMARPADFPWLGVDGLVIRKSAVVSLGDVLRDQGELLPLDDQEGDPLFILNARTVTALDGSLSTARKIPGSDRIMTITGYVFIPGALRGLHVFRIPEYRETYVTSEFVARVKEKALVGLEFELLWSSGRTSS